MASPPAAPTSRRFGWLFVLHSVAGFGLPHASRRRRLRGVLDGLLRLFLTLSDQPANFLLDVVPCRRTGSCLPPPMVLGRAASIALRTAAMNAAMSNQRASARPSCPPEPRPPGWRCRYQVERRLPAPRRPSCRWQVRLLFLGDLADPGLDLLELQVLCRLELRLLDRWGGALALDGGRVGGLRLGGLCNGASDMAVAIAALQTLTQQSYALCLIARRPACADPTAAPRGALREASPGRPLGVAWAGHAGDARERSFLWALRSTVSSRAGASAESARAVGRLRSTAD